MNKTGIRTMQKVGRKDRGRSIVLGVIGDTQQITGGYDLTSGYGLHFLNMQAAAIARYCDLSFHVGDIAGATTTYTQATQLNNWADAYASMVPYAKRPTCSCGNWDLPPGGSAGCTLRENATWNTALGSSHLDLVSDPTFETYDATHLHTYCRRMTVLGRPFIVFATNFGPLSAELEWMDDRMAEYPNHNAIIVTHCFYGDDSSWIIPDILDRDSVHAPDAAAYWSGMPDPAQHKLDLRVPQECWDGGTYGGSTYDGWKNWSTLRFIFCGHTFYTGTSYGQSCPQRTGLLTATDGHTVCAIHCNYQPVNGTFANELGDAYVDLVDSSSLTTHPVDFMRFIRIDPRRTHIYTLSPVTGRVRSHYRGGHDERMYFNEGYATWQQA